ncbi:MAG: ABC transporter permease [candidate division WOR-3 bacterium]|nr:ABC transporter permease [candidate division WOR-3 bacterium]
MKSSILGTHTITPPKGFLSINWRELWRFRELFLVMAWRDISVRYKQTALGILWAVIQPVVTMVVFTFIFNRVGRIESGDTTPYPIFLYVGLLFWQYYSNTLTNASNSLVTHQNMLQKIYFPRLILPATGATTSLVDMAIASLILAGMMIYYKFSPPVIGLLSLPVLLLCAILASLGFGFFLAAINVKYRDVRHALPFFIQILMYVTPVIYPVKMLDKHLVIKNLMLWLNPISGVITNARAALLGQGHFDWGIMGISFLMSCVYFVVGLYYFRNTERYFADIV